MENKKEHNKSEFTVIIISQEDAVAIPKNIMKINKLGKVKIDSIISVKSKNIIKNKKLMFLRGFGILQFVKMGFVQLFYRLLDIVDFFPFKKFIQHPRSLSSAAFRCGANFKEISNPNEPRFLDELDSKNLDLIISFSAPCIFKKRLLEIPKNGCINLHCSLLPNYAGLLPSFWTLFHDEKVIGATVHYMDSKIDNGDILGQAKITMPSLPTIFKVIQLTKDLGGDLVCDVIKNLIKKNLPRKNNTSKGSYFTWPTIQQMKNFKMDGGKLI